VSARDRGDPPLPPDRKRGPSLRRQEEERRGDVVEWRKGDRVRCRSRSGLHGRRRGRDQGSPKERQEAEARRRSGAVVPDTNVLVSAALNPAATAPASWSGCSCGRRPCTSVPPSWRNAATC
jgi:hypothetical protein